MRCSEEDVSIYTEGCKNEKHTDQATRMYRSLLSNPERKPQTFTIMTVYLRSMANYLLPLYHTSLRYCRLALIKVSYYPYSLCLGTSRTKVGHKIHVASGRPSRPFNLGPESFHRTARLTHFIWRKLGRES